MGIYGRLNTDYNYMKLIFTSKEFVAIILAFTVIWNHVGVLLLFLLTKYKVKMNCKSNTPIIQKAYSTIRDRSDIATVARKFLFSLPHSI